MTIDTMEQLLAVIDSLQQRHESMERRANAIETHLRHVGVALKTVQLELSLGRKVKGRYRKAKTVADLHGRVPRLTKATMQSTRSYSEVAATI